MFPLYYCNTCGFRDFDKTNIKRKHDPRSRTRSSCDGVVKSRQVKCIVPHDITNFSRTFTLEEYLQHQNIVDIHAPTFGATYASTVGVAAYDLLFTLENPFQRAKMLFDNTLSKHSNHPKFWNCIKNQNQVVMIDPCSPGRVLKRVNINKQLWRELALDMVKFFVEVICHPTADHTTIEGSKAHNRIMLSEQRHRWYNQSLPGFSRCITGMDLKLRNSKDTRFDADLEDLMQHIEKNLPGKMMLQNPHRTFAKEDDVVDLGTVNTGVDTVSVVFCDQCMYTRPSVNTYMIRGHIKRAKREVDKAIAGERKMPWNAACANGKMYKCRVKFEDPGKTSIQDHLPTVNMDDWMKDHVLLGKAFGGDAGRKEICYQILEANLDKLVIFENDTIQTSEFVSYIVWLYSHMYGTNAESRLQSLFVADNRLHVYHKPRVTDLIMKFPVDGIFIVFACLDKLMKWTKDFLGGHNRNSQGKLSVFVDERCLDSRLRWKDFCVCTDDFIDFEESNTAQMSAVRKGTTALAEMCDQLLAVTPKEIPQ